MKWFMALTYWFSKKLYSLDEHRFPYPTAIKEKVSDRRLLCWADSWVYRNDPLHGLLNAIYPLPYAAHANYGDCDDYAAKLYYHLQSAYNEPFLITFFTLNIFKSHTVVAVKMPNGKYRVYNWSKASTVTKFKNLKLPAVGRRIVFSTVYSRWDSKKSRWYTVSKKKLIEE